MYCDYEAVLSFNYYNQCKCSSASAVENIHNPCTLRSLLYTKITSAIVHSLSLIYPYTLFSIFLNNLDLPVLIPS